METSIPIKISTVSGNSLTVHPQPTETVRSIMNSAMIESPPNSQMICLSRGAQLQMDLSIGIQGLEPNDTIIVVFKKKRQKIKSKIDDADFSTIERQQKELFEEALRVSDVSFLLLEATRNATSIYRSIIQMQSDQMSDSENSSDDYSTVLAVEENERISSSPLPVCWDTDSDDQSSESDTESYMPPINTQCGSGALMQPNLGKEW